MVAMLANELVVSCLRLSPRARRVSLRRSQRLRIVAASESERTNAPEALLDALLKEEDSVSKEKRKRRRRRRSDKQELDEKDSVELTVDWEQLLQPGNADEESENGIDSIIHCLEGSPRSLTRRSVGPEALQWLGGALERYAADFVELLDHLEEIPFNFSLLESVQDYLDSEPIADVDARIQNLVRFHYPTVWDVFKREVRKRLVALSSPNDTRVSEWQERPAWKAVKKIPSTAEHIIRSQRRKQASDGEIWFAIRTVLSVYSMEVEKLLLLEEKEQMKQMLENVTSGRGEERIFLDGLIVGNVRENKADGADNGVVITLKSKSRQLLTLTEWHIGDTVGISLGASELDSGQPVEFYGSLDEDILNLNAKGSLIRKTETSIVIRCRDKNNVLRNILPSSSGDETIKTCRVYKLPNDVTMKRDLEAVQRIHRLAKRAPITDELMRKRTPWAAEKILKQAFTGAQLQYDSVLTESVLSNISSMDLYCELNDSQREAVHLGLNEEVPLSVIQGPPGTGKTSVLECIIHCIVKLDKKRVLISAPSNAAVDNILERLSSYPSLRLCRVGNPERYSSSISEYSLERLVEERTRDRSKQIRDDKRELRALIQREKDFRTKNDLKNALRKATKAERQLDREATRAELEHADCVFVTNTTAGDQMLQECSLFDVVIIDEAAQATEPSSWSPLVLGRRAILAGDVHQLGPTIISAHAQRGGLGRSLMARLTSMDGVAFTGEDSAQYSGVSNDLDKIVTTTESKYLLKAVSPPTVVLETQYRFNSAINSCISELVYGGKLSPSPFVADRTLANSLPEVLASIETSSPTAVVDTRDFAREQAAGDGSGSIYNLHEARVTEAYVRRLLHQGVPASSILVLSPYSAQINLIREMLEDIGDSLNIASIDSYQGREADAVVLSLVRSNSKGSVGFLQDRRRMNVAITRAKMHVCLVANVECVSSTPFLASVIKTAQLYGFRRDSNYYYEDERRSADEQ